jgi:hypothetical protein
MLKKQDLLRLIYKNISYDQIHPARFTLSTKFAIDLPKNQKHDAMLK